MPNEIPTKARVLVRARDESRCVRCGALTSCQWHHRRRRNVADEHQHCTCVGVLLCATCHTHVHKNPVEARANGWIVSAHEREPFTQPYRCRGQFWVLPDCDGDKQVIWIEDDATLGDVIEAFAELEAG